jgi:hypothetical protein
MSRSQTTQGAKVLFLEVQRFSAMLTIPFVLLFLVAIAFEGHMILLPMLEGGDSAWPGWTMPVSIAGIVLNVLISLVLVCTKLQIRLESDALYVRFFPFHLQFRKINFDDITLIYPRSYLPLSEFGGYGIRFGSQGRAYNISGNKGVQLEFINGHKLLLGSQKAEEFTTLLQEAVLKSRMAKGEPAVGKLHIESPKYEPNAATWA